LWQHSDIAIDCWQHALFDLKLGPTAMNHQPQDSRRQAARKFVNALDELETVLIANSSTSRETAPSSPDQPLSPPESGAASQPTPPDSEDLGQLLDEAVQDIEHFMAEADFSQDET
jgi:hypothetical protein